MNRRGLSYVETVVLIGIVLLFMGMGLTGLELLRGGPHSTSAATDRTCSLLRADLRRGAASKQQVLMLGGHRWEVRNDVLHRDDIAMCATSHFSWVFAEDFTEIHFRPHGRAERILVQQVNP